MKTVMITGCSSGFGLETARLFLDRGWSVVATMRSPREGVLPAVDRLRLLPLDVTNADSIARAVEAAGPIDVLVNNAGIGWLSPLEGTSMDVARHIFETNTLGTIAMTKAVLPRFRAQKSGVIVNVASAVTLMPLPMLSVYTASKAAVDAFTETLALELGPFNIRTRLVVPGRAPDTNFARTAHARVAGDGGVPEAYRPLMEGIVARRSSEPQGQVTRPEDVSEAIWRAATDPDCPIRLPAGADAVAMAARA